MWCIYRLFACCNDDCPTCRLDGDYHSEFVETTASPEAAEPRMEELRRQNADSGYCVRWVYGSQIANAN